MGEARKQSVNPLLDDNSPSQHHIIAIEGSSLTGSYGGKRFMKLDVQGIVGLQGDGASVGLLAIADFHDDIILSQEQGRVDDVPVL